MTLSQSAFKHFGAHTPAHKFPNVPGGQGELQYGP